ncbi:hypothetical protein HZB69_00755 [Candidatus Amesbacteria bacterium]|nr:hypothetical protein [Candidatus Amesbacteria bacterium]
MPDIYTAPSKKKGQAETYVEEMKDSKFWWKEMIDEVLKNVGETPRSVAMGAYNVRPGTHFVTQQEDEEVVLLLRAHPIINIPWIILAILMFIFPIILLNTGMFSAVPGKFIFMGRITWYLMIIMFVLEKILYWYYSVFIVTNERLVDIDFYNLMYRMVTYANLNHIEEPASVTGGFIRSLFQYGNVWVTTASEKPTIEALNVPYPDKVVDIISRLSEELEKRREQGK